LLKADCRTLIAEHRAKKCRLPGAGYLHRDRAEKNG
jgi:hypothetical protein